VSSSQAESSTWALARHQIRVRLSRNYRELRQEGRLRFARRKTRTFLCRSLPYALKFLILLAPALAVVILTRVVRPIVRVRFASLNAARLGHLALDAEMMLCETQHRAKAAGFRSFDVWCLWTGVLPIANHYLLGLWRSAIAVLPEAFGQTILQVNGLLPGTDSHLIPYRKGIAGLTNHLQGDPYDCFYRFPPHVEMPSRDVERCREELAELGVPRGAKFVCLAVRDPAYLSGFRHLGLEDHDYRNAAIEDYLRAAEWLGSRGIYVLRTGKEVSGTISGSSEMIIDYANSGRRTEMLDVFLSRECEFCLSTGNGFDSLALLFRRPVLYTNLAQLDQIALNFDTRFVPRNFISTTDGRMLPASEVYGRGLHLIRSSRELIDCRVAQIPNTDQEIADAVEEFVDQRHAYRELQDRFLTRVPDYLKTGMIRGGMSGTFLSKYPQWME
jgi:putative glycosyltransferase (TIGR04372 family)